MKDKKQVYQNPNIVIQYFTRKDIITTSNLTWNPDWNGNDWDNQDNTYIGD